MNRPSKISFVIHLTVNSYNISFPDCRPCLEGWIIWTFPGAVGLFEKKGSFFQRHTSAISLKFLKRKKITFTSEWLRKKDLKGLSFKFFQCIFCGSFCYFLLNFPFTKKKPKTENKRKKTIFAPEAEIWTNQSLKVLMRGGCPGWCQGDVEVSSWSTHQWRYWINEVASVKN